MDEFCWVVGPGLCGRVSFDVPIFEIIAMAIVSGLVTCATIYVSITQAAKQTDRAIEQSRYDTDRALAQAKEETDRALNDALVRDLRAAITALASEAQEDFKTGSYSALRSTSAIAAKTLIRTSGLPHSATAADWITEYAQFACNLKSGRTKESERTPARLLTMTGPAENMIRALSEWIQDPATVGPQFAPLTADYGAANKKVSDEFLKRLLRHTTEE